jgi:hypothetical protein
MATPRPVWNPDVKQPIDFYAGWQRVPETQAYDNGFKLQWEQFIRHVTAGEPYSWDLLEGAKGVQLAECALRSWKERRWIDVDTAPLVRRDGAANLWREPHPRRSSAQFERRRHGDRGVSPWPVRWRRSCARRSGIPARG